MSIDKPYVGKHISVIKNGNWEYVTRNTKTGNIVSIIPITKNNEFVLVEQYRIPVGCNVIEFPAGLIGDYNENETPLECAKKELLEETGYKSDNWRLLYISPKSPGLTDEIEHKFFAQNCYKINDGGGVNGENINVHIIPIDELGDFMYYKKKDNILISSSIYMLDNILLNDF